MNSFHTPVLAEEVLESLRCDRKGIYVDCTLGGGGHSEEILKVTDPASVVIGIDQDEEAIRVASERLKEFGAGFRVLKGNFRDIEGILERENIREIDGILFDLGVSGYQIDEQSIGFSFRKAGPLDMRMDIRKKTTAFDLINSLPQKELENVIRSFGEEKWAGRIARVIVKVRSEKNILTTTELAEIISNIIPKSNWPGKIHPATKTFQALRIKVNEELEILTPALTSAISKLSSGGRICVISYHSLEDRIVKEVFNKKAKGCICPPRFPECRNSPL